MAKERGIRGVGTLHYPDYPPKSGLLIERKSPSRLHEERAAYLKRGSRRSETRLADYFRTVGDLVVEPVEHDCRITGRARADASR